MDLTVYTPGDPQTLAGALRAVVMTLGTSGGFSGSMLADMVKLGMIGAVLMALFSALRNRGFPRFDHLMAYFIATVVLMTPTGTVTVESSYDGNSVFMRDTYAPQVVDDVPIVVGLPLSLGTSAGRAIGDRLTAAMSPSWAAQLCDQGASQMEVATGARCSISRAFARAVRSLTDVLVGASRDPRDAMMYNVNMFFRTCDPERKIESANAFWRQPGAQIMEAYCPTSGAGGMPDSVKDLKILTKTANSSYDRSGAITNGQEKSCWQLCQDLKRMFSASAPEEQQMLSQFNCQDSGSGSQNACGKGVRSAMDSILVGVSGSARAAWNDIVSSAAFACFMGSNVNRDVEGLIIGRTTASLNASADACNALAENIRSTLVNAEKMMAEADARSANWIVMATVIMPFMVGAMLFTGYQNMGRVLATFGGYLAFLAVPDIVNVTGEMIVAGQLDRFMQAMSDFQIGAKKLSGACTGSEPCAHDLFAYFREIANSVSAYGEVAKNGAWGLIALGTLLGITGMSGGGSGGGGSAGSAGGASGGDIRTDLQSYRGTMGAAFGRGASADAAINAYTPDKDGKYSRALMMGGDIYSGIEASVASIGAGAIQGFGARSAGSSTMGFSSNLTDGTSASSGVNVSSNAATGRNSATKEATDLRHAIAILDEVGKLDRGSSGTSSGLETRNSSAYSVGTKNQTTDAEEMKGAAQLSKEIAGRLDAAGSLSGRAYANALYQAAQNANAAGRSSAGNYLAALAKAVEGKGNLSLAALEKISDAIQKSASITESRQSGREASAGSTTSGTQAKQNNYAREGSRGEKKTEQDAYSVARELLAQESASLDSKAALSGGYQDSQGLQFASSFVPMQFSQAGMSANLLGALIQSGGDMRRAMASQLAAGGLDADQINRALDAFDQRYAQGLSAGGFNRFNTMFESASLAMADIGSSKNPEDRILATQGLMALSGHYDAARRYGEQARGVMSDLNNQRSQTGRDAGNLFGNAAGQIQGVQDQVGNEVGKLKKPESIWEQGQRLEKAANQIIGDAQQKSSQNPYSIEQAYRGYQNAVNQLRLQRARSINEVGPEQFRALVDGFRKEVAQKGGANPVLAKIAENPEYLAALAAAGPVLSGAAQAWLDGVSRGGQPPTTGGTAPPGGPQSPGRGGPRDQGGGRPRDQGGGGSERRIGKDNVIDVNAREVPERKGLPGAQGADKAAREVGKTAARRVAAGALAKAIPRLTASFAMGSTGVGTPAALVNLAMTINDVDGAVQALTGKSAVGQLLNGDVNGAVETMKEAFGAAKQIFDSEPPGPSGGSPARPPESPTTPAPLPGTPPASAAQTPAEKVASADNVGGESPAGVSAAATPAGTPPASPGDVTVAAAPPASSNTDPNFGILEKGDSPSPVVVAFAGDAPGGSPGGTPPRIPERLRQEAGAPVVASVGSGVPPVSPVGTGGSGQVFPTGQGTWQA